MVTLNVVLGYSPSNCSNNHMAQDFYNSLTELEREISKHNLIIFTEDMNISKRDQNIKNQVAGCGPTYTQMV